MEIVGKLPAIAAVVLAAVLVSGCLGGTPQNQAPSGTLIASPESGTVPLVITFTLSADDPDGSIQSWSLDVNNDSTAEYSGQGSPPATRQHTYQSPGAFVAKLTVTDDRGLSGSDERTITAAPVTQNQFPHATLTASPNAGPPPLTVTFTMNSSDPNGSIQTWSLDVDNDGTPEYSSQGSPPNTLQHTYQTDGTFVSNLTISDNGGAEDSDLETVTVATGVQNQRPTGTLVANPNNGAPPLTVTFTIIASDPDGSIQSWSLDVNNDGTSEYSGQGSPPATQQHTYLSEGSYTANLMVYDNEGAADYDLEVIIVGVPPLAVVLINEMEQNPSGNDVGAEWIELYNPGGLPVSLNGFRLQTTVAPAKSHYLGATDVIPAGGYLVVTFLIPFLTDIDESVILYDSLGREVDRTPVLNDTGDNTGTWQRMPNGLDTNQVSDWMFTGATRGAENNPRDIGNE